MLLWLYQILPDSDLKPQAKHLQMRLEYLMRVLKKHAEKSHKPPKVSDAVLMFKFLDAGGPYLHLPVFP